MSDYYWTPKRIKELKARGYKLHSAQDSLIKNKKNNLTKDSNYDKGIYNEKIQNKTDRHGAGSSGDNPISKRTNN